MQMLYKRGTEVKVNNLWSCDTIVAQDDDEVVELMAEGWFKTAFEACVDPKDREKALADIVKKSARLAESNAKAFAQKNMDPTGSFLMDEELGAV